MRSLALLVLAAWLCLGGGAVKAQSDDSQPADTPVADDAAPPPGPALLASDTAPLVCDPAASRFRYVEVRGTGFDAWATQRLVGNLVDTDNGVALARWPSVWVSPHGRLTLEVNLCADPFRGRGALAPGNYTVVVGAGNGAVIAATSIALVPPAEAPAAGDASADAAPTPDLSAPPRSGPGARQQPFPPGAQGMLADGWQLVVTDVTPDAYTAIHAAVPSAIAPTADQRDFVVRIQATYLGQGTGVFSAMRLVLLSGSGTTYDQLHNGCGVLPDIVPPNLVTAGGSVRGNICFSVRPAEIDSLVMVDNQTADNDRVYFSLK